MKGLPDCSLSPVNLYLLNLGVCLCSASFEMDVVSGRALFFLRRVSDILLALFQDPGVLAVGHSAWKGVEQAYLRLKTQTSGAIQILHLMNLSHVSAKMIC